MREAGFWGSQALEASQVPYIQKATQAQQEGQGSTKVSIPSGTHLTLSGGHWGPECDRRLVMVTSSTREWGRGVWTWTGGRKERQEQDSGWLARWWPGIKMSHVQKGTAFPPGSAQITVSHPNTHSRVVTSPSIPAPVSWVPLQGLGSLKPWLTRPSVLRTPQARASLSLGASEGLTVFVISPFNPQMGQRLTLF